MKAIYRGIIGGLLGVALAMTAGRSTDAAGDGSGFVVLPENAKRFAGPAGMESLLNSLVAEVLTGLKSEMLGKSAGSEGAFGVWRYEVPPGGGPGLKIHPSADEFFYVVRGTFEFQLGDRALRTPIGSFVFIRRDTVHDFTNIGPESGVLVGGVMPAGFERRFVDWDGAN